MSVLILILLLATVGLIAYPVLVRADRRRTMEQLVERCGWKDASMVDDLLRSPRLAAWSGPLRFVLDFNYKDTRAILTLAAPDKREREGLFGRLTVDRPADPLVNLEVRSRDVTFLDGSPEEGGIETGDRLFDVQLRVEGVAAVAHALLDAPTRDLLRMLAGHGSVKFSDSTLILQMLEAQLIPAVPRLARLLTDLASRLGAPDDLASRLATNAREDKVAEARIACFLTLIREFPEHPATAEAVRHGLSDPSPEIRLRAATAAGVEGRPVLEAMAGSAELDDVSAARAVWALGTHLTKDRLAAILDRALVEQRPVSARACIEVLGDHGTVTALARVQAVLDQSPSEGAVHAARVLGEKGDERAESALLMHVRRGIPELRLAACEALGRVGTAAALLPLNELMPGGGEVARAARQAIAAIRSRLPDAGPGQLSLSADAAGELSLADSEAGQVSLPEAEAGRVTVTGRGRTS